MKIQSLLLASLLVPLAALAQDKPAAPAQSPRAAIEQKAEALTEEQVGQSHDIGALSELAQVYGAKSDFTRLSWTLKRLTQLMPNSGDLRLQLAMAYSKAGDKSKAYDTLLHMQLSGFGYDITNDPRFENIHGTRVWDYLAANLVVNSKQFGEGKVAFELPSGDHLYDSLAWDAKRKQLLVGSVRDGTVQFADLNGKLTDFIKADAANGLWSADALGVDAAHGKLYVASSASPLYKGFNADNAGRAGVFEFDLASGKFLKKYILPPGDGAHVLNALAVGKDGNVYAADGARRVIYKLEGGALKSILTNPRLTGITALALSDDGKTLYLADYGLGVFGVDLSKSAPFELGFDPANLVLGGIDSMYWYDGNLIMIEGGMSPKRVMRVKLSDDGRSVAGAMPLDVAQPEFVVLGKAAVAGDSLYFVANRQAELYDSNGVLTDAESLEPTQIFRSNLRYAWGQKGVSAGSSGLIPVGPTGASTNKKVPAAPQPQPAKADQGKH